MCVYDKTRPRFINVYNVFGLLLLLGYESISMVRLHVLTTGELSLQLYMYDITIHRIPTHNCMMKDTRSQAARELNEERYE